MCARVRVLDDQTINQMAAGEVIESPASVVKELVDNAIDAGATEISVEIKGGGRQLIRITDNGAGMLADDALLALERHATSKISSSADLTQVATMGFRGEAIPSIASISKFTLITATKDSDDGTMLIVDGGRIIKRCPAARDPGTTVEVKSLFFNVPVRKKFQRSPNYDAQQIQQTLSKLALAKPGITFRLVHNQKTLLSTRATNTESLLEAMEQKICDVLGKDFFAAMLPVEFEEGPFKVTGYTGLPSYTRHNRTGQYFMINERPVWAPAVSYAITDGYGTQLATHRFPVCVLHISLPPDLVDINVHPQKREVRLVKQAQLLQPLTHAIQNALNRQREPQAAVATAPQVSYAPLPSSPICAESTVDWILPVPDSKPAPSQPVVDQQNFLIPQSSSTTDQVIGSSGGYLLITKTNGKQLELVKQSAAHRRILYEQLIDQQRDTPPESQALLIPITLTVSRTEETRLLELTQDLKSLGVDIESLGQGHFAVNAIPARLNESEVEPMIKEMIHAVEDQPKDRSQIATLARELSRHAVPKSRALNLIEAKALYAQLLSCKNPFECPFGRPIQKAVNLDEVFDESRGRPA